MGLEDRERKRSAVGALISQPVDSASQEGQVKAVTKRARKKKEKENLIQRGYYITPEIAQKVKIRAVMEGKNDYEIVQEALEAYLKE